MNCTAWHGLTTILVISSVYFFGSNDIFLHFEVIPSVTMLTVVVSFCDWLVRRKQCIDTHRTCFSHKFNSHVILAEQDFRLTPLCVHLWILLAVPPTHCLWYQWLHAHGWQVCELTKATGLVSWEFTTELCQSSMINRQYFCKTEVPDRSRYSACLFWPKQGNTSTSNMASLAELLLPCLCQKDTFFYPKII